ncbi:MAG: CIA30 family protein [Myxococcota bacterium]
MLILVALLMNSPLAMVLTDFGPETPDLAWYVVNDNVMGGRSEGRFAVDGGVLRFQGRTNTNGGGFSSIRSGPLELDLSARSGIRIRVRGDGRRYTWRLSTDARYRGREIGYWAEFETLAGRWITVDIPFDRFTPRFRGQRLDGPALNPAVIRGMGLMLYDGLDGPFTLELARVGTFAPLFSLESLRWRKRVVIVSGPSPDDERVRLQSRHVRASSAASSERDVLVLTLMERGPSNAGAQPLDPAEAAGVRRAVGLTAGAFEVVLVGKDGSVKARYPSPTDMKTIHSLIDTMPMRQREMVE